MCSILVSKVTLQKISISHINQLPVDIEPFSLCAEADPGSHSFIVALVVIQTSKTIVIEKRPQGVFFKKIRFQWKAIAKIFKDRLYHEDFSKELEYQKDF